MEPVARSPESPGADDLRALDADIEEALEDIGIPSYCIDAGGVIRWQNKSARDLVGDARGRQFTSVVSAEDVRRAREVFARKIMGTESVTDTEGVLVGDDGQRIAVEITAVPLRRGGRVIGVFGQVVRDEPAPPLVHPRLTARQTEILHHLERGHSTRQIADELHLSVETVRNHVRALLRSLEVHSRLEAVAFARRQRAPEAAAI